MKSIIMNLCHSNGCPDRKYDTEIWTVQKKSWKDIKPKIRCGFTVKLMECVCSLPHITIL
jgi:hypothetical protein